MGLLGYEYKIHAMRDYSENRNREDRKFYHYDITEWKTKNILLSIIEMFHLTDLFWEKEKIILNCERSKKKNWFICKNIVILYQN